MNTAAIDHLVQEAKQLSTEEQKVLIEKLQETLQDNVKSEGDEERPEGIFAGKGWIADDFDDPLPDEFWGFDKPL